MYFVWRPSIPYAKMGAMAKVQIAVSLDEETVSWIDERARDQGRSRASMVRLILDRAAGEGPKRSGSRKGPDPAKECRHPIGARLADSCMVCGKAL